MSCVLKVLSRERAYIENSYESRSQLLSSLNFQILISQAGIVLTDPVRKDADKVTAAGRYLSLIVSALKEPYELIMPLCYFSHGV